MRLYCDYCVRRGEVSDHPMRSVLKIVPASPFFTSKLSQNILGLLRAGSNFFNGFAPRSAA